MDKVKKYGGLAGWIGLSLLAGLPGLFLKPGSWYELLIKPAWTPPNWIFPVVWPLLYCLMGIAAWFIWKEYGFDGGRRELKWFGLQLGLNAAWSWIFFGQHSIGTALAEILLLWVAILFTLMLFWYRNKFAGILLVPYLLWAGYASALNFAIWHYN